MTELVGHFLLFGIIAVLALIVPLLIGRLVRPNLPTVEKDSIYECGEPTIGSSYVQFDLRYYVVALVFIVFDVEVIFFFPWALIYGGAMHLSDPNLAAEARADYSAKLLNVAPESLSAANVITPETAWTLGAAGLVDVLVFFFVLLVGFAYVWKRGDLDWVRAVSTKAKEAPSRSRTTTREPQPVG